MKKKTISNSIIYLIAFFVQSSVTVFAETDIQLSFPVACNIDEDCWIVNYVDVEPEPATVKDFTCGPRSYDNHKGTDIAIRDWQAMEQGVDVLAAASGKVMRLRDGVEDKVLSREQLNRLKEENKSCGNGVFIEHDGGWQTIYCHLKKNSIVVKQNQTITARKKIGQVGHSGYVEFPHLHIGIMHNDVLIDPYTGLSNQDGCRNTTQVLNQSLWADKRNISYSPVSIYAAGFSDAVPEFEKIKQDASSQDSLSIDSAALTFWVSIFGVQKNDQIKMEIRDPKDRVFSERIVTQERTRARQFLYIGKKNREGNLIKGRYTGIVNLTRVLSNGELIERFERKSIEIK